MSLSPHKFSKTTYHLKGVTAFAQQYFELIKWKKNSKILDIGSGPGHLLLQIEPLFPKDYTELVCIDKLEEMVNYFNSQKRDPRINAIAMDIQTNSLPSAFKGRFDFVFSSHSLMYWTNISFHEYNTGNPQVLLFPHHRTSEYESSPTYKGVQLFNHRPDSLKYSTITKFRNVVVQSFRNISQLMNDSGQLFFIWSKKGDVHDIYKAMNRTQKWAPYTNEFKNWINYFDTENPTDTLKTEFERVGIEIVKSEMKKFSYEDQDKNNLTALFDSVDYVSKRIPKDDLVEYKQEYNKFVDDKLMMERSIDNKIKWILPFEYILVAAKKS